MAFSDMCWATTKSFDNISLRNHKKSRQLSQAPLAQELTFKKSLTLTECCLNTAVSFSICNHFLILQLPEIIIVRSQIWYHPKVNKQLLISHLTSLFNHSKLSFLIWSSVVISFTLKRDFKYKQVDHIRMHDLQMCKPTDSRDAARPITCTTQGWPGWIYTPKDCAFTLLGSFPSQEAKGLMQPCVVGYICMRTWWLSVQTSRFRKWQVPSLRDMQALWLGQEWSTTRLPRDWPQTGSAPCGACGDPHVSSGLATHTTTLSPALLRCSGTGANSVCLRA